MASTNSFVSQERDHLFNTVLSELRALGVKVPKIKKFKSIISKQEITEANCQIFGVGLNEQEWTSELEYPIPKFIAWATAYLQKFIKREIGLFRKAGNCARQRTLKAKLEKGESLQNADPNDVACLLKQWLRELPEPLIPCYLQDLFIRCNCLEVEQDRVSACLFTTLLLPPDHMYTLKHLLNFLSSVSLNSEENKMAVDNLAMIMAPNIFMTNETAEKMNNLISEHTAIVKLMIENCDKIGQAPPSIFQRALLGADLCASADTLDGGSNTYKRRMSGSVQDILCGFKKLVGHSGSIYTRKSSSENHFIETPKAPRPALSLMNLDSPDLVTPKEKGEAIREDKKRGTRARGKSFGALLHLKKSRKRPENEVSLIVPEVLFAKKELPSAESAKSIVTVIDNSSNFSCLKLNSSFNKNERENSFFLRNSKETLSGQVQHTTEDSDKNLVAIEKPVVKYSKSCKWQTENESEVLKTHFLKNTPFSTSKSDIKKDKSLGKFGLSRQEAFSIKPITQRPYSKTESIKTDKENVQINSAEPVKMSDSTCSHPQTSACDSKCDKNKSGNCERKMSEKRSKRQFCSRSQSQPQKNKTTITALLKAEKVSSRNAAENAASPSPSKTSDSMDASENKVPQSLDLSLQLLLQNFCISPPNGSSEIKLSIDIEASNSNPELKLNLSQKETHQNGRKSFKISENNATKTRTRLSSQSDSKIPKLKKLRSPNRPSSFNGASSRQKERSKRHSAKILSMEKALDTARKSAETQNDRRFVSQYSTYVDDEVSTC